MDKSFGTKDKRKKKFTANGSLGRKPLRSKFHAYSNNAKFKTIADVDKTAISERHSVSVHHGKISPQMRVLHHGTK